MLSGGRNDRAVLDNGSSLARAWLYLHFFRGQRGPIRPIVAQNDLTLFPFMPVHSKKRLPLEPYNHWAACVVLHLGIPFDDKVLSKFDTVGS